MNDNPLAALAMRERAADECKNQRDILWSWPEQSACDECEDAIRALPTTFTDAELLAAAMQLPEVLALVDALRMASIWLNYDGRYDMEGINSALAPFTKVDK